MNGPGPMSGQLSASTAWMLSVASAVIIAVVSRWYDKYIESKYGAKRRLSEAELSIQVERVKQSGTAEGYLWKRIEMLEGTCEALRTKEVNLQIELSKALDDLEESSKLSTALAARVEELDLKLKQYEQENAVLVNRIAVLEGEDKSGKSDG